MKVAELFVRCLEAEGVEFIFGIPGEENLDVMEALRESSMRFIMTRHEQAAIQTSCAAISTSVIRLDISGCGGLFALTDITVNGCCRKTSLL